MTGSCQCILRRTVKKALVRIIFFADDKLYDWGRIERLSV